MPNSLRYNYSVTIEYSSEAKPPGRGLLLHRVYHISYDGPTAFLWQLFGIIDAFEQFSHVAIQGFRDPVEHLQRQVHMFRIGLAVDQAHPGIVQQREMGHLRLRNAFGLCDFFHSQAYHRNPPFI